MHEDENDDFNDLMDRDGEEGSRIGVMRRRKSKLLRSIRRRMSLVTTPMGGGHDMSERYDTHTRLRLGGGGRGAGGGRRRGRRDESDASSSDSDEDEDGSSRGDRRSARRRRLSAFFKARVKNTKGIDSKAEKLKSHENALGNSSYRQTSSAKRRSIHTSQGTLSRVSASRTLRMSIMRKSSKDSGDHKSIDVDVDDDEKDDVPSPLPRRGLGMIINESDLVQQKKTLKASTKEKKGPGTSKDGTAATVNSDKKSKTTKSRSRSESPNSGRKKITFAGIKDTLSVGTSGRGSRKRGQGRRRRKSNNSDDASVDSTPSVESTDNSFENRKSSKRGQQLPQQRHGSKTNESGLPLKFPFPRAANDENGLLFEAKHPDYYYQNVKWIIKSWIYFLTVVVPFASCYFCFVGIFHSATLTNNPLLKKVAFSNMLFCGLGCTFRSSFWARQTLDNRGVSSSACTASRGRSHVNQNNSLHSRSSSRHDRKRSRSRGNRMGSTVSSAIGNLYARSSTTMRFPAPRRRSIPTGSSHSGPSLRLPNQLPRIPNHLKNSTRALGFSVRGMPPQLSPSSTSSPTTSPRDNSGMSAANANTTIAAGNRGLRGSMPAAGHKGSELPKLKKPGRVKRNNSGGGKGGPKKNGLNRQQNTSFGRGLDSVWDVEKMLPSIEGKKPTKARPRIPQHASIMEIYEMHATDEKVALLQ